MCMCVCVCMLFRSLFLEISPLRSTQCQINNHWAVVNYCTCMHTKKINAIVFVKKHITFKVLILKRCECVCVGAYTSSSLCYNSRNYIFTCGADFINIITAISVLVTSGITIATIGRYLLWAIVRSTANCYAVPLTRTCNNENTKHK